jgi:hypothetical protein
MLLAQAPITWASTIGKRFTSDVRLAGARVAEGRIGPQQEEMRAREIVPSAGSGTRSNPRASLNWRKRPARDAQPESTRSIDPCADHVLQLHPAAAGADG